MHPEKGISLAPMALNLCQGPRVAQDSEVGGISKQRPKAKLLTESGAIPRSSWQGEGAPAFIFWNLRG